MKKSTIWILGILGFILICLCCLIFKSHAIEEDLQAHSARALNSSGLTISNLSFSGRDAILKGTVDSENTKQKTERIVSEIWGVNNVTNLLTVKAPKIKTNKPSEIAAQVQKSFDEAIRAANIEFENNSSSIKPISYPILNKVLKILNDYSKIAININGHTDSSGNLDSNIRLSKKRAESVKNYFIGKGVNKNRFFTNGFGSLQPVADNSTPEGRRKNRRVEFKIIKEN